MLNAEVRYSIDLNLSKIVRAKPPARRGCSAYASESDSTLHHSIFLVRYSAVRF
ncbi:hypothetical protein D1AOALGA4SA_6312 [Olavius algarvensis Delta 1 endosymbiont]|nr:hypothetical protein D1AOALGA4SA_6312 [Olavius algarvensis Delta 1 endosymbiont]